MVGLGIGVFFAGYGLLAYGWSQIHGANASLIEVIWPGSYKGPNLDPPKTTTPAPSAPTIQNPNPKNPITAPPKGSKSPAGDTPFGGGQPYIVS